jgi:hypothetical protein
MAEQGQRAASPWQAPQSSLLSSRPYAPRAAQAAWSPGPSPRHRPLRPARRQGRCVGHGEYGLAVDRRHFPEVKYAECVGMRPAHCRRDLAGDADRQRANVLVLDRKGERPFLPQHRELLPGVLGAAISFDPILRRHARRPLRREIIARAVRLPVPRRGSPGVPAGTPCPGISRMITSCTMREIDGPR